VPGFVGSWVAAFESTGFNITVTVRQRRRKKERRKRAILWMRIEDNAGICWPPLKSRCRTFL
jgi:hypothetical protein